MGVAEENEKLRRWVHILTSHKSIGKDIYKRSGITKDKADAMLEKSSQAPFWEPGASEKLDNNTLRVLLYKLCKGCAPIAECAEAIGVSSAELMRVLGTVQEQVENLTE